MTRILSAFAAATLLAAGAFAPAAQAADSKAFTTLQCFAANPAQQGDLVRSSAGIRNDAAGTRLVYCPLVRDEEDSIVEPTTIAAFYRMGAVEGTLTCTAYHGSSAGTGGFQSSSASVTKAPNTRGSVVMSLTQTPAGFYQVQLFVVCAMGPGVTLSHIYLNESGPTELSAG
jgi:hypothetical protein